MIQNVSSATPLEKVDYKLREDGLADIRIRRNIKTVKHEATDNQPEYTEYTAIESYQVLPLMEQEAINQADVLFEGDTASSKPVLDRVAALEQASLDNAQLLADLMTGEDDDTADSTEDSADSDADADSNSSDADSDNDEAKADAADGDKADDKNTADKTADSKDKE